MRSYRAPSEWLLVPTLGGHLHGGFHALLRIGGIVRSILRRVRLWADMGS